MVALSQYRKNRIFGDAFNRKHKLETSVIVECMEVKTQTTSHYQRLYLEYAPMLLQFARKFVSDFFAEDIVHDVFLKLWDKQIFLLPDDDIRRILYVAVRNACLDYLRRLNMEQEIIDHRAVQLKLDELDFFEASDELFMRNDLLKVLMDKVSELPERSQEVFRMSYIEGLKAAEIADRLGLSVRTVENLLYRSLATLRKSCSHLFLYLIALHSLKY